jgi:hypothetical protein
VIAYIEGELPDIHFGNRIMASLRQPNWPDPASRVCAYDYEEGERLQGELAPARFLRLTGDDLTCIEVIDSKSLNKVVLRATFPDCPGPAPHDLVLPLLEVWGQLLGSKARTSNLRFTTDPSDYCKDAIYTPFSELWNPACMIYAMLSVISHVTEATQIYIEERQGQRVRTNVRAHVLGELGKGSNLPQRLKVALAAVIAERITNPYG